MFKWGTGFINNFLFIQFIGGKSTMARKMKTMDGNHAAAHASYAFTDVAAIFPITLYIVVGFFMYFILRNCVHIMKSTIENS